MTQNDVLLNENYVTSFLTNTLFIPSIFKRNAH